MALQKAVAMFGMEDTGKKKKQGSEICFDLEKELVEKPEKAKNLQEKAQYRAQELKKVLREGNDKEKFDTYGILLHGYISLKKVIERVVKKGK